MITMPRWFLVGVFVCLCAALTVSKADAQTNAAATRFFQNHPSDIDIEQQGDLVLFANRQVGLAFRQGDTGFELVRMYGIEAGQDFLAAPPASGGPSNLFEIQMATDPKYQYRDESAEAVNVKITDIINRLAEVIPTPTDSPEVTSVGQLPRVFGS